MHAYKAAKKQGKQWMDIRKQNDLMCQTVQNCLSIAFAIGNIVHDFHG